jgi:hypothetical protein
MRSTPHFAPDKQKKQVKIKKNGIPSCYFS